MDPIFNSNHNITRILFSLLSSWQQAEVERKDYKYSITGASGNQKKKKKEIHMEKEKKEKTREKELGAGCSD